MNSRQLVPPLGGIQQRRDVATSKRLISRSRFLRLAGLAGQAAFFGIGTGAARGIPFLQPEHADRFHRLVADSFVMDGNANLGIKRGHGLSPLAKGEVIRLTGIKVGNHSMRPSSLGSMSKRMRDHPGSLLHVKRARDLDLAWRSGRYGVAFYVQGGFDLGDSVEPLSKWKEEGLRVFQITLEDNELGGGAESDERPLTRLGKQVVRELNRLHLVVDVSHCGKRTTLDTAAASSAPITANHANAERLTPHSRNKSDEELKAIAATGGVVGVTNINRYLMRNTSRPATVDDFVAHLDYMVEKIGIDHVGISSDSWMDGSNVYDVDYSDPYLNSYDRWRHVVRKLGGRGYSDLDIQKILGLNFKRVYEVILDP